MFWKPLTLLLPLAVFTGVGFLIASGKDRPAKSGGEAGSDARTGLIQEETDPGEALGFDELYVTPAGPKGLEYSAKARGLEGKRVSMTGHMVKHYHDDPSLFMFSAVPTAHNQLEYILADSLPVNLVHVVMQVRPGDAPAFVSRKITLTGSLEMGPRQEIDGRTSNIRLICDQVRDSRTLAAVELRKPLALQRDRMVLGTAPNNLRLSKTSTAQAPPPNNP